MPVSPPAKPAPLRRAWALSYALRSRPTQALSRLYFDTLKRLLADTDAR